MNNQKEWCQRLEDYFDDQMSKQEINDFKEHLHTCQSCQKRLEELAILRKSLSKFSDIDLNDEADLRLRRLLKDEPDDIITRDEILDIEGVARFLKISVPEVVDLLDQLPSFEVGGRIRFRRENIIDWIKNQEKKLSREREHSSFHSYKNIIQFPGGKL